MTDEEKLSIISVLFKDLIETTGATAEEILEQYTWAEENTTYVRVKKGRCKGKIGYMFPDTSGVIDPYTREVYLSDGSVLMCNGWSWKHNLQEISKEEYEAELIKDKDDDT